MAKSFGVTVDLGRKHITQNDAVLNDGGAFFVSIDILKGLPGFGT